MFDNDFVDENLSTLAQSCRHLSPRYSAKRGNTGEPVTCNMCSSWDGDNCTKKVHENFPERPEPD